MRRFNSCRNHSSSSGRRHSTGSRSSITSRRSSSTVINILVEKAQVDLNHIDIDNTYSRETVLQIATNHATLFAGYKGPNITHNIFECIKLMCKKGRITRDTILHIDDDNLTLLHNAAKVGDHHLFAFVFDLVRAQLHVPSDPDYVFDFVIPKRSTKKKASSLLLIQYIFIGTAHNTQSATAFSDSDDDDEAHTRDKIDTRACPHFRAIMKLLLRSPYLMTNADIEQFCYVGCRPCLVDLFEFVVEQPKRQMEQMQRVNNTLQEFTSTHYDSLTRDLYIIINKLATSSSTKKSAHDAKKHMSPIPSVNKDSVCSDKKCSNRAAQYCSQCNHYYCKSHYMNSYCDTNNHSIIALSALRSVPVAYSPSPRSPSPRDDALIADTVQRDDNNKDSMKTDDKKVIKNNDDAKHDNMQTDNVGTDNVTIKKQRLDDNSALQTAAGADDIDNHKHL